jgi:nucleoid-associated protein YgaU
MTNKARVASELFGLGAGGGLEKLTIHYKYGKKKTGKAEALFNPSEISTSRSVNYRQKLAASKGGAGYFDIKQKFLAVEAATLSIELFFDTYESRSEAATWKRAASSSIAPTNPFQSGDATDVREYTQKIVNLALPDTELHRPPVCTLKWGEYETIFVGVMTQVDERYTMFLANGTPVRATLSCSFVEYRTEAHLKASELHSADVAKTHQVRRGDTLQSIAAEEYNDPSLWRLIARANGIVNPRELRPGALLAIPKLRP